MTLPKLTILAPLAIASVLSASTAFAQDATGTGTAPTGAVPASSAPSTSTDYATGANASAPKADDTTLLTRDNNEFRRVSFGAEAQMLVPVGDLSEDSGLLLGPVVRFGYRVARPVELTASAGYLFGLTKSTGTSPIQGEGGLNLVPLMVGARFFFFPDAEPERSSDRDLNRPDRYSGLYLSTDIGLNLIIPKAELNGKSVENLDTRPRFGGNAGLGYIISKRLPIDVRAQFSLLNLFGKEDQVGGVKIDEKTLYGIGISAGYTAQF